MNESTATFDRTRQFIAAARDRFRRDAEFAVQHFGRRGGAEAGHADEFAAVAEPARPVALNRGLDAYSWNFPSTLARYSRDCWRNRSKHGAETTAARMPSLASSFAAVERDRHFGARGNQGDVATTLRLDNHDRPPARPD